MPNSGKAGGSVVATQPLCLGDAVELVVTVEHALHGFGHIISLNTHSQNEILPRTPTKLTRE